jgi:hypothetical protein
VDFGKEKLLYFAWSGPGGDQLWFVTEQAKGSPIVVFRHYPGPDPDVVRHWRLFALGKDAAWKVEKAKEPPDGPPGTRKDDPTAQLLKDLDDRSEFVRAAAIDLLGERKAREAIPKLIELVADGTALPGSDHYVGVHAVQALEKITGQRLGFEQKEWKAWWAKQKHEEDRPPGVGIEVLSVEAKVELRGVLAHTPKGTFVVVRAFPTVNSETWELSFAQSPDLEKLAKELSGKRVVVQGACKVDVNQRRFPDGGRLPLTSELERLLTVSKLAAAEEK